MFLLLLFVLNQMDVKFGKFKKEITEDFDRRYGYIEKDIKEAHELGILFHSRKDGCDEIQAALPIIQDLKNTVGEKTCLIKEQLRTELTNMFAEFVKKYTVKDKKEQAIDDIKDILGGL